MESSDIYIGIPFAKMKKALEDLDSAFERMLVAQHDLEIILEKKKGIIDDVYRHIDEVFKAYAREVASIAEENLVETPSKEAIVEQINKINDILEPIIK